MSIPMSKNKEKILKIAIDKLFKDLNLVKETKV